MQDCNDLDILSVTTTVGSRPDAERLGRAILEHRLAACVQIEEGLTSLYRWQGRDCAEAELRLTIKTLPGRAEALQALLRDQHPYELPQFASVVMKASRAYFDWVHAEVQPLTGGEPDAV